ncbi:MAG: hypothetical protein JWN74_2642 [Acidobacteriaceae bacterium]|nr:hypothetical protein [Acidobacteriaceae bacterium]
MGYVRRHRLPAAEYIFRDRGGRDALISVVNIVDVLDVENVRDVRHVSYVRDIDQPQIIATTVIPGEKWIEGTKRKPCNQVE